MYYVYILYSQDIDKYYIGYSADVKARLARHLQQHKGFTNRTKDWKIMFTEAFNTKEDALAREKQIKRWKSRHMIKTLINSQTK